MDIVVAGERLGEEIFTGCTGTEIASVSRTAMNSYRLGRNFATLRRRFTSKTPRHRQASTKETMSQQLGASCNHRDQHQFLECLRCNFIAHMSSDVHAEHDWQHRTRRD